MSTVLPLGGLLVVAVELVALTSGVDLAAPLAVLVAVDVALLGCLDAAGLEVVVWSRD